MSMRRSPTGFFGAFGVATLVAGTVAGIVLPFNSDPDKCTIILSRNTPGGTLGFLTAPVAARGAAATTFTITSTNAAETSTVNWLAIPKNVGLGASTTFVNNGSVRRPPSGNFLARGRATLVAGTVTVTPGIPFSSEAKIFVCANTFGGTSGKLSAPVASVDANAGTFVINSNQAADTSVVNWLIVDQAIKFPPNGPRIGQSKGDGDLATGVTFTDMNPLNDTEVFLAASIITAAGTPGNLRAFLGDSTGGMSVQSSTAETSLVETLAL